MKISIPGLPGLPELPSTRDKQNKNKQATNFFISKNHMYFHCRKTEQKSNATSEQHKLKWKTDFQDDWFGEQETYDLVHGLKFGVLDLPPKKGHITIAFIGTILKKICLEEQ